MDDSQILDGLLILIGLLLLPIGYRRGAVREVFTTAALFAGAALAASWGRPWGTDLADQFDMDAGTAQFVVSTAFLVGSALILGYASGNVAIRGVPRRWARAAGALLAVVNVALMAAYLLDYVDTFLADEDAQRTLAESDVARVLMEDFGWVLIGAAGLGLVMTLLAWLFQRRAQRELRAAVASPASYAAPPAKGRSPRLRWGRDDDKVEPVERGFDPSSGRYAADAPHYAQTMPIAPVQSSAYIDRGRASSGGEWLPREQAAQGFTPVSQTYADGGQLRCPSCGERLTADDAFCPRCGRART